MIVLMGGRDFFSNGIHLNVIEAADDPAGESWRNLHAINDVVREIVETESHLVISALTGDAAAGGVPFALAADRVYAREDVVLNPYYGHMGGLYGSEYWTYLLPRRVGAKKTARLTEPPFTPLGTAGRRDRVAGRCVRLNRGELPSPDPFPRTGIGLRPASERPARRKAPAAGPRRTNQTASGLPSRGDGSCVRVPLRARPQLSRGKAAVRP